ncbi:hypothetical protein D3C83_212110 [compost metagenome]
MRAAKEKPPEMHDTGATLLPAAVTTAPEAEEPETKADGDELNVEAVLANLRRIGGGKNDRDDDNER